jgi:hypothetical protein
MWYHYHNDYLVGVTEIYMLAVTSVAYKGAIKINPSDSERGTVWAMMDEPLLVWRCKVSWY